MDELDARIADMADLAAELEDAPLEVLQEHEDAFIGAYGTLGRVYNRWLMQDWKAA